MDFSDWKRRVGLLKRETYALYLAARDPRVPWYAKWLIALVVAYALSPIDLIPDFVPLLGYLDDLILIPAGIALAIRLIPRDVLQQCREKAAQAQAAPRNWYAAGVIIVVWLLAIGLAIKLLWPALAGLAADASK
ncbi:MAG: YkvA family protein [Phycisphaerae bacterium]|jgi:uncharacterized membrane protein YkvA (DUF1232 family)